MISDANPTGGDCGRLVETLRAVGKEPAMLIDAAGSSLVVVPYGGRVLGLFGSSSSKNFLWTNPALAAPDTARALYESDRWHNSGGDRTWLAPERDYFYPDFPDTKRYVQPRQFDAGSFRVECHNKRVVLLTEFDLDSYRTGAKVSVALRKEIELIGDPLRQKTSPIKQTALQFAGYRLSVSLSVDRPFTDDTCLGIWNLLQLPGGGMLFAPTYFRTEPTVFFGDIPAGHIVADRHYVRYLMSAPGEQKICISALATTGRLGYVRNDGAEWVLVVRQFDVDPIGGYRDVWPTHPDDDGYAVQACNINTQSLGIFAEMEYHAPVIDAHSRQSCRQDTSRVWAYHGEADAIAEAARVLLGVEVLA